MIRSIKISPNLLFALCATTVSLFSSVRAQDRKLFSADVVPRDRLISTGELFHLLELNSPALKPIADALHAADTSLATRLLIQHFQTRSTPRYFFNPTTVPSRVASYEKTYADDAVYLEKTARTYMKQYGIDMDWRMPGKDLRGKAHTPNTVRQLARQLNAENFAMLYYRKGRENQFAEFQVGQIRDFLNDFAAKKVETGGNDIFERFYAGHRVRNWMMFHQLLLSSDALTAEDHIMLLKTFLLHGGRIIDQCKKFNWGNHQLVGLCALYEMTLMYPEFTVMGQWNAHVFNLILEHLNKEIREDGFQFERASHYFKLDIFNYFRVFRLAEANKISIPGWANERFRSMFHAILAVLMPDGSMPPLQDAQDTYVGSRNLDEARRRLIASETPNSAELVDPEEGPFLALGGYLFHDPQLKFFGSKTQHAAFFWFLPENAQQEYNALAVTPPSFGSIALASSGYYIMRGGWGADDPYMIIDGGLAQYKPDHTHGGVLGVIAYANGQMILPNYRVRYSDSTYPYMKNSWVKNVALSDSLVQGRGWIGNVAQTGFGKWAWLPTPTVRRWETGDSIDHFEASHNGFDTVGVSYIREVLFVKPSFWVVRDKFTPNAGTHTAQQIWQGNYTIEGPGHVRSVQGSAQLDIYQVSAEPLTSSINTGTETSAIVFHAAQAKEHEFVTVLIPSSSTSPAAFSVQKSGSDVVEISNNRTSYRITFRSHEPLRVRW